MNSDVVLVDCEHVGLIMHYDYPNLNQAKDFTKDGSFVKEVCLVRGRKFSRRRSFEISDKRLKMKRIVLRIIKINTLSLWYPYYI